VSGAVRSTLDRLPSGLHRLLPSAIRADLRHRIGLTAPGDLAFDPVPPHPAPGERTGPPDFAVLGAAAAGSRWWLSLIADHPDVSPGRGSPDVAHFFARYCTEPFGPAEIAAFHAWFPRRAGRIIGFWSADGTAHPWVPPLLAAAAPRACILVLLRDPVERMLDGLDRTVDDRAAHVGSYLADAVDRGMYAEQITRLYERYPADQVLVLQTEACAADPVRSLARTYGFLGVDPAYRARQLAPPPARAARARDLLDPSVLERLRGVFAEDVAALGDLVPGFDPGLWPNVTP
jgi:hypothetical protein